jgi:hypothetical protein
MAPQEKDLLQQALDEIGKKNYLGGAALYEQAIREGDVRVFTLYNAACCYALGGDATAAFGYLARAVRAGFREISLLEKDSDLESLHADSRWNRVLGWVRDNAATYRRERSDPQSAKLITSDIPLFWQAYDLAQKAPVNDRPTIYAREYLNRGSVGLRDWQRVRRVNGARLAKYVETHPKFFETVRDATLRIDGQMDEVRRIFVNLQKLYPATIMADTYLCIGPFAGGGTVSDAGLLLSAEMQALTRQTFLGELSSWERSVITEVTDIPALIAHEMIHFQQNIKTLDNTLLRRCLQEGSADFLAHLAAGYQMVRTKAQHRWCNAHEQQLWTEFQREMKGFDSKRWLYSGSEDGERPVDTGYYMGYKISEAYYKNSKDKKQAIYDILNITDCPKFLERSRYTEKRKR